VVRPLRGGGRGKGPATKKKRFFLFVVVEKKFLMVIKPRGEGGKALVAGHK